LGSTNGMKIGGARVDRALVQSGSQVRLGHTHLRVTADDSPVPLAEDAEGRLGEFVTCSPMLKKVLSRLRIVARTEATVLIEGETGTGKEVLARAVHEHSLRREGPFVVVDCGAVNHGVLESQLFGHMKGSFTGAISDRVGAFEA